MVRPSDVAASEPQVKTANGYSRVTANHWLCVQPGDEEAGRSRPQGGHGLVRPARRCLSLTPAAAERGGAAATEAGLHGQWLAVMLRRESAMPEPTGRQHLSNFLAS